MTVEELSKAVEAATEVFSSEFKAAFSKWKRTITEIDTDNIPPHILDAVVGEAQRRVENIDLEGL